MFQSFQNPTLHYNTSRPPSFPPPFLFCKRRHLRRDCRIFFGGRKFFFGGLVNCWGIGYNPGYRFFKTHKGERNDTFAPPHEFGNRTNLTAFCAAFVRVFSRLFSHQLLAVAAVLCGALSAQSASAYGAIAVGGIPQDNKRVIATNQPTAAAARTMALTQCGAGCFVVQEFVNQCAALAIDSISRTAITSPANANTAGFYTATDTTTAQAKVKARNACVAGNLNNLNGVACAESLDACDTTCLGATPILDSGSCRARQQSDCTGGTPILDSGNCRAAIEADCTGGTPILDGGSCRARQASDCTGNTPILDSGSCRARQQSDCTGNTPILDSGNCRARQQSDCTGNTPILDSGSCRAATQADCTGGTPIFENGNCRARQQSDCTGNTPILDGGNCRARQASDCTGNTPILDSGSCRARQAGDCTGNTPILDGGNCRARQAGDCTGNTPILDGGNCRARQASDCTGNTPILDSGSCRAATQADCTGGTPILDSGACRARQQSDCTGNTPILDSGSCRAATQADCTGNRPIFENGNCRARQASDCTGATPILHNGACVATRPTPPTTGSASSDDDKKARFNRLEVASGFVAIAGAIYAFSLYGGVPFFEAVQWSPHYNFAMSDGVRRYEVGSRWEWKHDNLSAHWTATKTASDSFAYGSGAKWTGDIFTAAFNSQETGKDTELDFSLLAKKEFGVWSFSPQYRVNFDRDETDETWRHSLALRAVWTADKWTLSNSAGFHGKSLAAFGDNASAKVLLRREF